MTCPGGQVKLACSLSKCVFLLLCWFLWLVRVIGIASGITTFVGHAHGASEAALKGVILQRGASITLLMAVLAVLCWTQVDRLLNLLGEAAGPLLLLLCCLGMLFRNVFGSVGGCRPTVISRGCLDLKPESPQSSLPWFHWAAVCWQHCYCYACGTGCIAGVMLASCVVAHFSRLQCLSYYCEMNYLCWPFA
jgi:hypothetical protein